MVQRSLYSFDLWSGEFDLLNIDSLGDCPACKLGRYEFLEGRQGSWVTSLCGRNAVQINVKSDAQISFMQLAERLRAIGDITFNEYMLRLRVDTYEINLFSNGRAIINGCNNPALGRALYAKYVGV